MPERKQCFPTSKGPPLNAPTLGSMGTVLQKVLAGSLQTARGCVPPRDCPLQPRDAVPSGPITTLLPGAKLIFIPLTSLGKKKFLKLFMTYECGQDLKNPFPGVSLPISQGQIQQDGELFGPDSGHHVSKVAL